MVNLLPKPQPEVIELIKRALVDEPSNTIGEGGVIRAGFSEELDHIARYLLTPVSISPDWSVPSRKIQVLNR